jgi:predicted CoA-binding protein
MTSPTVAVLGMSDDPAKAGYYVAEYLNDVGYRVIGVNPNLAGREQFGNSIVATLAEIAEPIDMIDVFRRQELLPAHQAELIAAKPKVVWFQLGIRNDEVARELEKAGIVVVQDRCTMADHQRMRLGKPAR